MISTYNSTLQIKESRFDGFGITVSEGSTGTMEDCLILNSTTHGIFVRKGSSIELRRNIVANSKFGGIILPCKEAVVESNLIMNNKLQGLGAVQTNPSGTFCNNLIIDNKIGIHTGSGDLEIVNNVILRSIEAGMMIPQNASCDIEENVIVDNKTGLICKKGGKMGSTKLKGKNLVYGNQTQSNGVDLPSKTFEVDPEFTEADAGLFSLESRDAKGMGLSDPELIHALWKKWKKATRQ